MILKYPKPRVKKGYFIIKIISKFPNGNIEHRWEYIPKIKYRSVTSGKKTLKSGSKKAKR